MLLFIRIVFLEKRTNEAAKFSIFNNTWAVNASKIFEVPAVVSFINLKYFTIFLYIIWAVPIFPAFFFRHIHQLVHMTQLT